MTRPGTPSITSRINAMFFRFEIICHICNGEILAESKVDWDHVLKYADNKSEPWVDTYQNLSPVHRDCHRRKSAREQSVSAHIDRLERTRLGKPKRARDKFKKKIKSRGFSK